MATLTLVELRVLKQKYGPMLEIVAVQRLGDSGTQLSIKTPAGPGFFDLTVLVMLAYTIKRGVNYHIYEMVHSVFSPH